MDERQRVNDKSEGRDENSTGQSGDRVKMRKGEEKREAETERTVKVNRCAYNVEAPNTFKKVYTQTHAHARHTVPSSNVRISQCNLTPPCSAGFIPADSN